MRLFIYSHSPFPLRYVLLFLWGVCWLFWFFRFSHNIFRTLRFLWFSSLHLFIWWNRWLWRRRWFFRWSLTQRCLLINCCFIYSSWGRCRRLVYLLLINLFLNCIYNIVVRGRSWLRFWFLLISFIGNILLRKCFSDNYILRHTVIRELYIFLCLKFVIRMIIFYAEESLLVIFFVVFSKFRPSN